MLLPDKSEIKRTLEVLRPGGTILYPTDTIWGIGCDATNKEAIESIYRIKQREDKRSLLVLLDSGEKLYDYVAEVPDIVWELLDVAVNPLTIVYPGAINLPGNLTGLDGSIGIRISSDPFCCSLIRELGRPLVSTSANIAGMPAPSVYSEISKEIRNEVDYVVKWRQGEKKSGSKASGIIKVGLQGQVEILRN